MSIYSENACLNFPPFPDLVKSNQIHLDVIFKKIAGFR